VATEFAKYKLGLVGVRKVRWDKEGTVRAGVYISLYGKVSENHQLEQDFLYNTQQYQQLREWSV
jgi:hypothetical protein